MMSFFHTIPSLPDTASTPTPLSVLLEIVSRTDDVPGRKTENKDRGEREWSTGEWQPEQAGVGGYLKHRMPYLQ